MPARRRREHGIVKGIGIVNCIYVNPKTLQFWVIDYRIFNPDNDGLSKVDLSADRQAI